MYLMPNAKEISRIAKSLGANVVRFDRCFDRGYALDPERVKRAMTARTVGTPSGLAFVTSAKRIC